MAGLSAWGDDNGAVPFAITSNSFIARQYADIALAMLPEVSPIAREACKNQPLYVVELGAGQVGGCLVTELREGLGRFALKL